MGSLGCMPQINIIFDVNSIASKTKGQDGNVRIGTDSEGYKKPS